jgi:hypothetical protein
MAQRGRKPKLTPETLERLKESIVAGNTMETSCDFAGINKSTFYNWLTQAEEPNARKELLELKDTITRAKAEAIVRNVTHINSAAKKSWQAAAWWLERTQPKDYGRNQRVELTGVNGGSIDITVDAKTALLNFLKEKQDTPLPKAE